MVIAARVAAQLRKDSSLDVTTTRGGFGELSVSVDGQDVPTGGVLGFATPSAILDRVRAHLSSLAP